VVCSGIMNDGLVMVINNLVNVRDGLVIDVLVMFWHLLILDMLVMFFYFLVIDVLVVLRYAVVFDVFVVDFNVMVFDVIVGVGLNVLVVLVVVSGFAMVLIVLVVLVVGHLDVNISVDIGVGVNNVRNVSVVLVMRGDSVVNGSLVVSRLFVLSSDMFFVRVVVTLGQLMVRDTVLHLSTKEDLGESEADGVTIFVEVLVLPLSLSIHDLVVNILSVHDQIVLDMEDEVPRVCEGLGHLAELVKISSDGSLALFELVGDVVNDVTEVLNSMEHSIE